MRSSKLLQQTVEQAQNAEATIVLDKRETRRLIDQLIDQQLRRAKWEVVQGLTYAKGARLQKGRDIAIAECSTREGRADYALFVGLQIVAVVEAKRQGTDVVEGALNQAKRYCRAIRRSRVFPLRIWSAISNGKSRMNYELGLSSVKVSERFSIVKMVKLS